MFQVNDTVMYGSSGVCKISEICAKKFGSNEVLYYVLKPLYDENSTIYCPVDSPKLKIRELLSVNEIYQLIQEMPDAQTAWIDNEQKRKEKFSKIIKEGDHRELIRLIRALYFNREEKHRSGKKFYLSDERMMKEAETILHEEFAHVLNIQIEDVVPFIMGELQKQEDARCAQFEGCDSAD